MHKKYLVATGVAASMALAACGGGDNAATITPVPTVLAGAEGVYTGTVSNGLNHLTLVLENGDLFVLYGKTGTTSFAVSGFLRGSGTSSNGAFSAPDIRDFSAAAAGVGYTLTGTYVAGTSLKGTVANAGGSVTYTGTALNDTTYAYANAATPANIAGAWNLTDLTGAKVALAIAADGKFTGTSGSCTLTGSLTPRASGKNVFDFTLVYGAAPCALPGQAISGAAVDYLIGTSHQFIAAGTDAARTVGVALIGTK